LVTDPGGGLADIGFGLVAASLVYPFGVALGVTLVGRRVIGRGRYWHALVGAFIALMVLALIAVPLVNIVLGVVQALLIILPPIFATLAYRRFSRPTDYLNPYDDDDVDLLKYHDEGWEDYR
jgi:glucose-6-phosphate-specific signal transduction histidine kinase